MIVVEDLVKDFGPAHALKGISFEVKRGEVIGFLGPNGAGKSTTMKILAGFLSPTSGRAAVAGFDVVSQSLEVRRRIGYLPETTPLYTEMRVDEYLAFAAAIRGVPRARSSRAVGRAVELCGLQRVLGKNIRELSKGYRQRTGLAQALIHEPEVLVLDEPTSGLDPNQIVEVRRLIERLGQEHTVILSTHYLQEVEKSADRIIVISLGEIVADATLPELLDQLPDPPLRALIKGPDGAIRSQLEELLPGVRLQESSRAGEVGEYRIELGGHGGEQLVEAIAHLVVKNGWGLLELAREQGDLEDVFRQLTLDASREAGNA